MLLYLFQSLKAKRSALIIHGTVSNLPANRFLTGAALIGW